MIKRLQCRTITRSRWESDIVCKDSCSVLSIINHQPQCHLKSIKSDALDGRAGIAVVNITVDVIIRIGLVKLASHLLLVLRDVSCQS